MRFLVLASILAALATPAARAQDRIAFANVELILAMMPETAEVNRALGQYQKELAAKLRTKEEYAQQKLEEAQEAVARGAADTELQKYREDLARLEDEIRAQAEDSDRKMGARRDALMEPVVAKLSGVFRDIALEEKYDFILNNVDGSGTSIVLFGREDRDVTKAVLDHMGIKLPQAEETGETKGP